MIPSPRDVAHQILGVICRADSHNATCDRVTSEIVADRSARAVAASTVVEGERPRVIYVAGPFRSPTHWGIVENVRRAEAAALEVWKRGAIALCPHLNTANFQGALPDGAWLYGTLELMRRCDAVVLVEGWESSSGTMTEIAEAETLGIPVLSSLDQLDKWLSPAGVSP